MRVILLIILLAVSQSSFAEDEGFPKKLFEARCSNCHQLPEPSMLNARQWKIVLQTMQQRMQHIKMAPMSKDEIETIHGYIVSQIQ
jgi:mono/diheme cytochrome c family protein